MNTQYIVGGQVYVDRSFQQKTGLLLRIRQHGGQPGSGAVPGKKCPNFFQICGSRAVDVHPYRTVGVDINEAGDHLFPCRVIDLPGHRRVRRQQAKLSLLHGHRLLLETAVNNQYKEWKKEAREGAELLGIHLEGPFLAPAYKGAMPEHLLRQGDAGLLPGTTFFPAAS